MALDVKWYNVLIDRLRLLAADAETQLGVLPSFVAAADEIALSYHDCVLLVLQDPERFGLAYDQLNAVKQLDDDLAGISNRRDLWSNDALRGDPIWETVRVRAHDILRLLGARYQPPALDGVVFVRGPDKNAGG